MHSRAIGADGEARAAAYLQSLGYSIVRRNYHSRTAELDIIARRDDCLFFVEVKMQRQNVYGGAAAHVTRAKRYKIARAAERYLFESGWKGPCGFLVVAIDGDRVEVIEDFLR
ncbi:MAG: YraN family protein [Clostridiales bacterium]|nr:YraN family protein [Clostridiales bacterium]